jgi:ligand-binding sensor domain-containing protein
MIKIIALLFTVIIVSSCENTTQATYDYSDSINEITIDSQGNVWFGTSNFGIVEYNGSKWKNYRKSNSAIPSNWIGSINFDSRGNLWAATMGGVVMFDGKNFITYDNTNSGLPTSEIVCLAVDKKDRVWVGTFGKGLWVFDGKDWGVFSLSGSVEYDSIRYITVDDNNIVWIVSYYGIYRYDGNMQLAFNESNHQLPDYSIYELLTDKSGNFWVAGSYGAAFKTKDDRWTILDSASNVLTNFNIRSICVDSNNVKWIATVGGGIASFDGSKWTYYNQQNSGIYSNFNKSIAADKSGNIWVGTYGKQVSRFDGKTWKTTDIYDF